MSEKLAALKTRLAEAHDLGAANAVLSWDQTTYMPMGGAAARGRQMATIARLAHEKATDPAIGDLISALEEETAKLPYDSDDAALVRAARRSYDRSTRIPGPLIAELYQHMAVSYSAWAQARPANDYAAVYPMLAKTLDLSRRVAECFPHEHIADPLIDMADYGMKATTIRQIFGQLREQLVPIVQAITSQAPADDSFLRKHYPEAQQIAFGEQVIRAYGYDFERGRQDKTLHPFCTTFSIGDVRITTRINEHDLGDGLFSTLHESGHAMYEQGGNPAYEATPLMGGTSAGVHESQSRLWENLVGRSRAFWEHYYGPLQKLFPEQLAGVSLDQFYRAINKVQRSLIRVDADEVTYNLHVIIRFDLELALLEGSLDLEDLPDAWRARYQSDIGISAPDDRDGVLQDVHWYAGLIGGAFQGYTLGNILSAQLFDKAIATHPSIPQEIGQGQFGTLHNWLRSEIYQHGSKYTAPELIERVTGGPLRIEPYIAYLRRKYGELYSL
ncbi:MAG: carboxypeptidase M32 [Roseiflexaceae bacterium]